MASATSTRTATDDARSARIPAAPTELFYAGGWAAAASGRTFPVDNPATGEIVAHIADASAADAERALESAAGAQPAWARTAPRERSEILRRAHELMLDRADDLARLVTAEMGKPLAEARGEVAYAAEFFRWFA